MEMLQLFPHIAILNVVMRNSKGRKQMEKKKMSKKQKKQLKKITKKMKKIHNDISCWLFQIGIVGNKCIDWIFERWSRHNEASFQFFGWGTLRTL